MKCNLFLLRNDPSFCCVGNRLVCVVVEVTVAVGHSKSRRSKTNLKIIATSLVREEGGLDKGGSRSDEKGLNSLFS